MTVLENGSLFAFRRISSQVAYIAISVKTGTRDEGAFPAGLAHFTEHLIFKGTETRTGSFINSCIEKLGGELNAYTAKEETVLHATVLKEDLHTAADLLFDIAFNSIFPEKEIEKERAVVIEEIKSYKDSPADRIFDDFEEMLFGGTPLSTPVLGRAATLRKITREDLVSYWKSRFVAENICVTVAADMDESRVLAIVRRAMARRCHITPGAQPPPTNCGRPSRTPIAAGSIKTFTHEATHRHHQAHCIIGGGAYSLYEKGRLPLVLLANYLGGPAANSTLNLILRERNGLVYGVEAAYTQYEDTGLVTIYFGCDGENLEKCRSLIFKELSRVRDTLPSASALKMAKKQLLGQLAISSDSGEAQVLSMGKNLMVYGSVPEPEQVRSLIGSISAEEFRDAAAEVLDPSHLSMMVYK